MLPTDRLSRSVARTSGSGEGRVLVTSGSGFIGSALVWALNPRGVEDIVVADFLDETEKWRNLAPLRVPDDLEADDMCDSDCARSPSTMRSRYGAAGASTP